MLATEETCLFLSALLVRWKDILLYVDLGCMLSKVLQAIPSSARAEINDEPLPFTRVYIWLVLDRCVLVVWKELHACSVMCEGVWKT